MEWTDLYSAFLVFATTQSALHSSQHSPLSHTHSYTGGRGYCTKCHLLISISFIHIHAPMAMPPGATGGSVSCPRILRHVDCRGQGMNRQPSGWWTTTLPPEPQPPGMYYEYSICYCKYGKTLNWVHLWTPCLQCNNHCAGRIENGRIFCTKMSRLV